MLRSRRRTDKDVEQILHVFKENKQDLVRDGQLQPRSALIWSTITEFLDQVYSPLALFTIAAKNYYNSKQILGLQEHLEVTKNCTPIPFDTESDEVSGSEADFMQNRVDNTHCFKFDITLSYEEYEDLNKHIEVYGRKDAYEKRLHCRKSQKRQYGVFQQRHWTHILSKKIEPVLREQQKNCVIIFKRCKLYGRHETKFADFLGKCSICLGKLYGYILNPPQQGNKFVVNFLLTNYTEHHSTYKKRPLSGKMRQEMGEHLVRTNIAPSHYRKILASREIDSNFEEPSWLPNLKTIRAAKHEIAKKERLHDDPVYSICQMKVDPSMKGAIRNIGVDPFFVYFWSNTQLHVYNRYCESEYSRLCIDATGSVVKKIRKVTGEKSKHIFLYDCAVLSKKTHRDNQYSVCNMLSESQNAVSIYSWLAHWIKSGARTPNEVVTDMSLALLYAVTLAFTNCKSLEEYLQKCYGSIFENKPFSEKCHIRLDVAHLIKLASQWSSLKNQHRLTRQFYLKSVGQLIQCTDITDAETLIRSICTVALSDTEGVNMNGQETTCEIMKNWLKRRSSTGTIEQLINISQESNDSSKEVEEPDNSSCFQNWVNGIANECNIVVNLSTEQGDRGNQQCVPSLVKDLKKLCTYLPLWSGIMSKYFPLSDLIGSSAPVESNFNDIKNRIFGNITLPIRVDEFLKGLILASDGANKLAMSAMNHLANETKKKEFINQQNNMKQDYDQLKVQGNYIDSDILDLKIYCPSCQLKQTGNDICSNCGKVVHLNQYCSKKKGNKQVCLNCAKLEQLEFENWRGLGCHTNKRARTSYLEPSAELMEADYGNLRHVMPIGLLRNGHLVNLKPIRISSTVSVTLSNTCAFDSVVQLMASAFCDSDTFKQLIIINNQQMLIAKMINSIIKTGITKQTYRLRAEILMSIFNTIENPCGILSLNVETEINNILRKIDFNYCAIRSLQCSKCSFFEAQLLHSIEVTVSYHSYLDLSEFLMASLEHQLFRKNCYKSECHGELRKKIDISPTHIFLEPLNTSSKKFQLNISLDKIQKKIVVSDSTYILRGAVGYVGPEVGVGHFVCYSFRHNNKWEKFDDLMTKSQPCSSKTVINIQTLLFTL